MSSSVKKRGRELSATNISTATKYLATLGSNTTIRILAARSIVPFAGMASVPRIFDGTC